MLCSVSTCDFIQSIAAKSRLQVQKCLKYLNLFVMYPFSCQLLPLFEYTKYHNPVKNAPPQFLQNLMFSESHHPNLITLFMGK